MRLPRRIANRYARALADVTEARKESAEVRDELEQFALLFAPGTEAHRVFDAPTVPAVEKQKALEAIIERARPRQTTANALRVLLKNHRLTHLEEIVGAYREELDRRAGLVTARISTARPVAEDLRQSLVAALERATGWRIRPEWRIEPDLIGGMRAEVGSTVFDGSVKAQLEGLRERLAAGHVPERALART
jgi:F-type H+-transporting ATPase subunit delta